MDIILGNRQVLVHVGGCCAKNQSRVVRVVLKFVIVNGQAIGWYIGVNTTAPRRTRPIVTIEEVTLNQGVAAHLADANGVISKHVIDDLDIVLRTIETQSCPGGAILSADEFEPIDNDTRRGHNQTGTDACPVNDRFAAAATKARGSGICSIDGQ